MGQSIWGRVTAPLFLDQERLAGRDEVEMPTRESGLFGSTLGSSGKLSTLGCMRHPLEFLTGRPPWNPRFRKPRNLGHPAVDSPYKLVAGSVTDTGVMGQSCSNPPTGTQGFQSLVVYTIMSFRGVQVTNVGVNETFANLVDDYTGNSWGVYIPGSYTSPSGQFADNICVINPSGIPHSLPPQSPLSSVKIDHGAQAWFIGSTTEAAGVEVQSNVLQRYQDHGRHLSIVSPVR